MFRGTKYHYNDDANVVNNFDNSIVQLTIKVVMLWEKNFKLYVCSTALMVISRGLKKHDK